MPNATKATTTPIPDATPTEPSPAGKPHTAIDNSEKTIVIPQLGRFLHALTPFAGDYAEAPAVVTKVHQPAELPENVIAIVGLTIFPYQVKPVMAAYAHVYTSKEHARAAAGEHITAWWPERQ